jgi:hypothetical protein
MNNSASSTSLIGFKITFQLRSVRPSQYALTVTLLIYPFSEIYALIT